MMHQSAKRIAKIVDDHWTPHRKNLKRCRKDASEDNIHDLRTGIRRLIAVIQLLDALMPTKGLRKIRKTLKYQLDGFDQLRDTQVMLMTLAPDCHKLPALQSCVAALQQREATLLAQAPTVIAHIHNRKVGKVLKRVVRHLKKSANPGQWLQRLANLIEAGYQRLDDRYQAIDAANPDSLHQLRIAVKKQRYLLSAASPLLTRAPTQQIETLKNYQDVLGEIQNSAVLMSQLEAFFDEQLPPAIDAHYRQIHAGLVEDFWQQKDAIARSDKHNDGR